MAAAASSSSSTSSVVPAKPPSITWKTRLAMAFLTAVTDLAYRRNGTINRRLLSLLDDSVRADPTPSRGVRTVDFTVDAARNLWFRLFIPTAAAANTSPPLPLIVFFHGGGFAFLSAASRAYDAVCRRLARELPAVVASVNYRLAPEHKFPAPYADGLDALRFLDDSSSLPDIALADLSSTFLAGDSAGGNIVHHVARRWAADAAGGGVWRKLELAGLVVIQPYFGGEERTEAELRLTKAPLVSVPRTDWLWRAFLPEGADRDHEACNVFGPRDAGELEERYPAAVMVVVGGWDPLKDWQRRFAEGLRRRGREVRLAEYGEAHHAFYLFPDAKEGGIFLEDLKDFINAHRRSNT